MNIHAESTLVRIREFYLGKSDIVLTEDEQKILQRMEEAFSFLRDSKSHTEAVLMLKRRYPEHSKSTLYRDVNAAMALFGDVVSSSKDAIRKLTTDYALNLISRSRAVGDRNNENKALALLAKINGLELEDVEADGAQERVTTPPVIEIPESLQSILLTLPLNGAVNLMELRSQLKLKPREQNTIQPAPAPVSVSATEGEVY